MMLKLFLLAPLVYAVTTVCAQNKTSASNADEVDSITVPKNQSTDVDCTELTLGQNDYFAALDSGVYVFDTTRRVNLSEAKDACVARGFKIAFFSNLLKWNEWNDFLVSLPKAKSFYWFEVSEEVVKDMVNSNIRRMITATNYCTYIFHGMLAIAYGGIKRTCDGDVLLYPVCEVNAKFMDCVSTNNVIWRTD